LGFLQKLAADVYHESLNRPLVVLMIMAGLIFSAGYHSKDFTYDASADTLVAENDPELAYYRKVTHYLGGENFLFLTYTPKNARLITPETIRKIDVLAQRLEAIEGVAKVTSILDAPLLKSPPIPVARMAEEYRTLQSPDVDLKRAAEELTASPLFKNLLISEDGQTTAFRIDLATNERLQTLADQRNALRAKENKRPEERAELKKISEQYRLVYAENTRRVDEMLDEIRQVRDSVSDEATAYLGGVPMVASDMIKYVKKDVFTFGLASIVLIMGMLFFFFRRLRWVLLPIVTTAVTIFLTIGLLGYMRQPVTVISSNFVSLLAILSISFSIHLIAKYRELVREDGSTPHEELVCRTMIEKLKPCLYTALTTIVAFGSLMTSSIVPVTDFGWIMCLGVLVAFLVAYTLFPALLMLAPKGQPSATIQQNSTFIRYLCHLSTRRTVLVLLGAVFLFGASVAGVTRLSLDSRFIDYFKPETEIYKGLAFIDKNLGGTIPMDIILEFPPYVNEASEFGDDFFTGAEDDFPERYWYTPDKIQYLRKFHQYLESRREIGKVISLATLEEMARDFNDGKPLGAVEMIAVLSSIPDNVREEFIAPYASPAEGLMRISTRIHETGPPYSRNQLIQDIESFGETGLGLPPDRVRVTGVNVLFNGMLQELFSSQTSTLLFVIGATFLMFVVLLRSPLLAFIGLVPNVLAALTILAFMGFVGMPLDMMTITIAAIIIGIGVDDAIHYLHHFREIYVRKRDVIAAVEENHRNIGNALYYTSVTVVIGFSVLGFSNFVPTVYFGALTALAMVLALLANLTVLPALLVKLYR
jgi:hypothetical protein